jgi:hypothetical protein
MPDRDHAFRRGTRLARCWDGPRRGDVAARDLETLSAHCHHGHGSEAVPAPSWAGAIVKSGARRDRASPESFGETVENVAACAPKVRVTSPSSRSITTRRDSPEPSRWAPWATCLLIFSTGRFSPNLRSSRNLRVPVGGEVAARALPSNSGAPRNRQAHANLLALAPQEAGDKLVRGEIDA